MESKNLLFIFTDQHTWNTMGCAGHPVVQTPNLDRLAARGTRFANAYTNCPICVPARASLATGRYVHQIGNWDNAAPYCGEVSSWHHRVREQGHQVDSVGKLHFRSADDDNGFTKEIEPLHVVNGLGDILGCIRVNPPTRDFRSSVLEAGSGYSSYYHYDLRNAENGGRWLKENGRKKGKPWVLFVSFACPHPPFIAAPEYYEMYRNEDIILPAQWKKEDWPNTPFMNHLRTYFNWDDGFDEFEIRRLVRTYYAMCSFVDVQIGQILDALESEGLAENTRIIYSSDHGESVGARGTFVKISHYDESAAVPLIIAGPDVPKGKVVQTPVSLVECFPSVVEAVGAQLNDEDADLPGESLWRLAAESDQERTVFSEYHAVASENAWYMLRNRRYKYVYHVDAPAQLFDMQEDPDELEDLASFPESKNLIEECERQLRQILDPEATDKRAKTNQTRRLDAFGGREAAIAHGAFVNSPVPGEKPKFVTNR